MIDELWAEIGKIDDEVIRSFTMTVAKAMPENSWKLASSRDHHIKDECGEWGNLLHTLRVARICDVFGDILNLTQIERDALKSAAILHDSCKHGVSAEAVFIYREHPQLVKRLFQKVGIECNPIIAGIIEQHMGRWGTVPFDWDWNSGKMSLSFLLHAADCIEARTQDILKEKQL